MSVAAANITGWVLAGGQSRRMGRDKALLDCGGITLLEKTVATLRQVVENVTVIGPPERYCHFGFPVIADLIPDCGPIGGLYTALKLTNCDWNLVVACDMPGLTAESLRSLTRNLSNTSKCFISSDPQGNTHPLCALYHRDAFPLVAEAIEAKAFRMFDLTDKLRAVVCVFEDNELLANVNTPSEWEVV